MDSQPSSSSSSKKRPLSDAQGNPRGGRQQRVRLFEQQAARNVPASSVSSKPNAFSCDSHEALSLLLRWSSGEISAVQVQKDCYNIYKDQCALLERLKMSREHVLKSIAALAQIGSWGRLPGNANKELLNLVGEPLYCKPTYFKLNARIEKPRWNGPIVSTFDFAFLLPHVAFSYMFNHNKEAFFKQLFGPCDSGKNFGDQLEDFWSEVVRRKDPRIKRHPMCLRKDWMRRCIPVSIHGDAVPVLRVGKHGSRSLDCISFQSLLARGETLAVKFLIFCIFEQTKLKKFPGMKDTMCQAWEIIMDSFKALFNGKHPCANYRGTDGQSLVRMLKLLTLTSVQRKNPSSQLFGA